MALDTDPGGTVTITLVSLDPTVATLETPELTFTSADWSVLQDVNVTIQYDDNKVNERTAITHTISGYGEVTISDMPVEILDNEQPIFIEGETPDGVARRTIAENPAAGTLIGLPVSATDNDNDGEPDELLYTYSQTGDLDRERFTINNQNGQLLTKAGEIYDYETEPVFRIGMLVNDGRGGVDSINVIIRLTDVNDAPVFTEGDPTTRSLPENSGANVNVGDPVSATDQDRSEDTLVYSISEAATEDNADRDSFKIEPNTGQLTTKEGVSYDHETKASYLIVVEVSDGAATAAIAVTVNLSDVNEAPTFDEGDTTTRSLAENTPAGQNVGAAVSATDQDGNTLIYTLTGTDAGSFEIDDETGQLTTKSGVSYDYEAKASYAVTVEVIEDITDNFSDTIAVTVNLTDANDAPVFSEGDTATRSVPENSGADVNVGLPLAATDQDNDTLTYTLGGTDAGSFEIDGGTGQLTTKQGVSYDLETKASYSVTVTAADPDNAADSIAVTVNLTDVNDAPTFSEGDTATRSVPENSGANVNVGAAVAATDQDRNPADTLTYTLGGTDAGSFEIVASSGQLQTKSGVSYDLETKASYSVTVTATDPDNAADTIAVTVNLTDVNDAPTFTEGESATRSLAENTAAGENVGAAVAATDQDRNPADTLTYTLTGTDAASFEIVESSGQLTTKSGVSYDLEVKASYTVTVGVSDGTAADTIAVTVNLTDVNDAPTFTEGDSTTRSLPENSGANVNVGAAVSATDQDRDTLTYTLSGTDAGSFEIVASSGQLTTKSGVSYDLETKASYTVTVGVSDGTAADSIAVTINLTDVNDAPTFTEGDSATRSVPENSGADVNVGAPLTATDQDGDTLTYTLGGTDAGSFEIVASSGQLTTKSGVSYDYEAKSSYAVTVTATDPDSAADTITVTVNLTDVNDAPTFTEGESATRSVPENSGANVNVGNPVLATDQDTDDTLTYTLSGTDTESFVINASTGQLTTKQGVSYDLEAKASYSVIVTATDPDSATDTIAVTVNLTDVNDAPTFSEGDSTTRTLAENSGANVNVGDPVAATDQDNDTLTYTLTGTDASSFEIVESSGQLTTKSGVSYDLETKASYTVTVTASDPDNAADTIAVTVSLTDVNDAPTFTEGESATRSLVENTAAGQNVGAAVSATDQDRDDQDMPKDTLTYSISEAEGEDNADKGSFEIVASSGQLTTKSGVTYDYEAKPSYSITVEVSDGRGGTDTIAVTVNLTDVNDAPTFTEGESATRSLAENTPAGENVGAPLAATDQDGDTLTYTLSGTDAGSFEIVESSGQLTTKSGVSYDLEAKASYAVTVTATDPDSAADSIAVTINLTDVNDAPTFTEGDSTTRSIPENSGANVNVGAPLAATDQDNDTLAYTLGGTDAGSFEIDDETGQLTTKSGVNYDLEAKASYMVTVTATDPDNAADTIAVTVNLTDVNDAPTFTDGDSTTRSLPENSGANVNVGLPLTATDQDRDADGNPDTLTYTLGGTDAGSFEIDGSTGQLKTKSGVSYDLETKASYSVTVTATDPDNAADTIAVTVNLTDVNERPDPPTNLRARPTANAGEVLLEWTPPADNTGRPPITKYEVWNRLEGVADWSDQKAFTTGNPPPSTLTITNLKTGQKYDFRVRTVNHEGVSEWAESTASGYPRKPVVTITNKPGNDSSITEGDEIGFRITADPYNNVPLVVKIKVETTGEYGITGRNQDDPLTITIPETGLNQPAPLPHDSGTISTDNDEIDEENGSVTYTIIAAEAYDVGEPKSLTIAIEDNDERKIEVGAISGTIPENGGTATYSVILTSEPTDNVTVTPSSNDQSIATVSGTLTFEPENWNTEQYVTVTGVNDDIDNDGDSRTTTITHTVAGGDYGSLTAEDVTVTVTDDDTKGITFEPTAVTVGEAIGTTSYTVVLDSEPTADVTITLAIAEVEGTDAVTLATAGTLAFTNTTWDMPQTVELTITDDSFDNTPDDRRTATITHTADGGDYGSVSATLTVIVTDDDGPNAAPSFDGTTTTRDLPESIGAATDTGGTPIGDPVTAVDADDATLTYSLSGTDIDFFEIDTATGQLKTKAGVTYDHEDKPGYTVTVSVHDGKAADGRPDASIDDDITVTINITDENEPPNRPPAPTIETTGNSDSLRVTPNAPDNTGRPDIDEYDLQYRPKDSGETFTLESNIGGQGTLEQLLLNTEYEVQVRARNDEGTGDWSESATQRTGTATATIIATPTTINESGATNRSAITARLEGQLTQDLTLTVSATPEAPAEASDFTLSENVTLTIAAGQTDSSGTVTVTAQDNQVDNDDRTVNVGATSETANLTINGAAITIQDDDTRGITATPDSNVTTEAGGTVTVGVKLNSQPTAAVTISAQSSNTDEGTVSPVGLTFTTGNWNTAQDVTVTGQDDSVDDGDTGYAITFTAASPDPLYEGQQASVELTNTDDDTRSVEITTTSTTDPPTLRVSEVAPGNTASYTVVLTSQPSDGNVTVTPVSSAPGNATVSAALIFTPQNWNTAQPVTITAVDDLIDNEADRTATITHEVAGADYGRHNVVAGSIEVTVTDNDEEGVTVSRTELTVGETGDGSYTIVLNSQPTGTVTVTPAAGGDHPDAIAITPPDLTFTTENWNNAQTVTVTGQRDHVDNEADRTATISHSAGGDYAGVTITGVEVTITDSDTAGVTLDQKHTSVTEGQQSGDNPVSYTVVLDSKPRTGHVVKINITVAGPADTDPSSLTFTRENWNVPQSIRVTAHDDGVVSEPRTAVVSHQIVDAESSPEYGTVAVDDVSFDIVEDDHAPVFGDGESTAREVPENSVPGVNVGAAVEATDGDSDTLTYTLTGTDSVFFGIHEGTGQITTQETSYDFETKPQYAITVTASDTHGNTDSIAVTINLTDVNDAPVFTEGDSATRSLPENSGANVNVGAAVLAMDQDRPVNTLVYSLTGTDAESFDIDGGTGQLRTKSGVSYDRETKPSYSVTVGVSDGTASATIDVTIDLTDANDAPVFTEGESATRSLAENSGASVNVGDPVTATDQDGDTLTYTLGGTDAESFEIDGGTGQLTTKQGVSYDLEAKASYSVTVGVSDGTASDSIAVTINLTDANDAPVFTEGDTATRSLPENSGAGVNVGAPLAATDQDRNPADTLTYTLGGTDAASFEIVETSGQLQTKSGVSYDLETKASYTVTVGVSDGTAADSIDVTINLTDVNDAPTFTEGESATRSLAENSGASVNVGAAVSATDQDNDTLTYTLDGTDAGSFEINASTGQLTTKQGVSYDLEAKASYSVTVGVSDGTAADTIAVTVNLTDANDAPTFTEGESATRSVPENSGANVNVGLPLSATDQDNDTLTYTLGGDDAGSFEINASTGQLTTKSGVSYDLEAKASYSVTVGVSDGTAADTIAVTVNLTDANDAPVFTEGESAVRSLAENTAAGENVGLPLSATDQDRDEDGNPDALTYTLSGTDAASFEIVESSGQLTTKSGVSYDLETKASYTVTVTATDPDNAADTIAVTINLTDVNDAPTFTEGDSATRTLPENSGANVNVGAAVAATDQDGNTLTYTLSGTDAGSFEIDEGTGQLTTKQGASYDYETKASYSVTVTATDPDSAADTIAVTVNLTDANDAPTFSEGDSTTRSLAENTAAGENVGAAVSATDQDNDTLTYTLGGTDAASFEIAGGTGQLTTKQGVSYDLEAKASYSVTVTAADPDSAADTIAVTVNLTDANDAPVFSDGDTATRSVPENSGANVNVGAPLAATDQDTDTLTYTLSGTDAVSFEIVASSGQLTTKSGVSYDLETKASYTVTVGVSDGTAADSISVTVNLTDVNDAPVFSEGDSATRSLPENSGANVNVGLPLSATDQDTDTLTYTLSGTDAASFEIVASSGQLTTKSGVSYDLETKASYSVTVTATDPDSAADTIAVTVNLTDANDAPVFTEGDSTTRSLPENTAAGENVGAAVSATDQDGDTLTYTLTGTDATSFEIDEGTGQLTTKQGASYDYETKASYTVTVGVSDGTAADSIAVTINLTDVNDAPTFTEGDSATRSVPENSGADVNVGAPLAATDQDRNPADTLTYTLGGTDAGSFEIVESSGQLTTKSGVSYDLETKASYTVTVTATDPDSAADSITVTVNLTDANDAPVFSDGDSTTRSLPENSGANVNVGAAVSATDQDGDTLTYSLSGTDAGSFEIDGGTGQLTTKQGVSYDLEAKASYSVTVTATDPDNAADTIDVTINLTDANDAPVFTEGDSAVRSVPENSGANVNVGAAVSATDQDGDTLTYSLSGTDAGSFEIDGGTGQLTTKQGVSYDLEAKASYSVTVGVSDPDNAADTINVTINLTDANDAPVFTEGESAVRSVPENSGASVNVGAAVSATDQDNDTLTYSLSGTDAGSFDIDDGTGQLQTKSGVSYDLETKASYSVTVTATDPDSAADTIAVTVNLTDVNDAPTFSDGDSTTRSVAENTAAGQNVGAAVSATDQDGDTLTYTLGGTDAGSFEIDGGTGQLTTRSGVSYDLETKASYTVTVGVSDGTAADTIAVTVNLTDANDAPVFSEGDSATRSLPENTAAGQDVGLPLSATDQDNDTLTYTLGGTDAASFEIDGGTGQLTTKQGASYDYEAKASYSVTVTATDPDNAADTIGVTVNLTDVNEAPVFTEGDSTTRAIAENTAAGENVGAPVTATDQNDDRITYSMIGMDASFFDINANTGQLTTKSGVSYDYETKVSYTVNVMAADPEDNRDSITVTVNLTDANDPPVFSEGDRATRSIPENTAAARNIGAPVTATDQDGDTITYTLSGRDAASFQIDAGTGQLLTRFGVTYDVETRASYSVTVGVSDGTAADSIAVAIHLTDVNDCTPSDNIPANDTVPTIKQFPNTSPEMREFPNLRVRGNLEFRLEFPAAVGGNGGPYYYDLRRAGTGDSLSNNSTVLPGVSFDPYGHVLRGWLTTHQGMSPAIHQLEYVIHDGDGNCSPEDSAVIPLTLTASEEWPHIFIDPQYPWVAEGEDAVFVVRGTYAYNVPTVTLEIAAGDNGVRTRRDTVRIPVTVTEGASVEYAVPTADVDAVTVALVPQDGYIVHVVSWLNSATVKVVEEVIRPVVTVSADGGSPTPKVPSGGTIVLRGWHSIDPPYESGTGELTYYEWEQTKGPQVELGRTTHRNLSVTIPEGISHGELLDFTLTVKVSPEGSTDMDTGTGTGTVRIQVTPATGASGSGDPDPEPVTLPTANAGPDLSGAPGESVTIQGTDSTNPYGEWWQMEHQWTQLSGPSVTLDQPTHGDPTFTISADAADGTTLEFQLTVTDQEGESDSDTVTVTVVVPDPVLPTACAGPDLAGAPGDEVTLQGKCSVNPYGRWHQMTYQWTQLSGPAVTLTHPRTTQPASKFADPSFTVPADAAGGTTLAFELTVTDQEGQSDSDTMIVTVATPEVVRPTATAGPDLSGAPGESVTLQGKGSTNPYGKWYQMAHAWTQLSGPSVTLDKPTHGDPTFTIPADAAGGTTLEFQLTVTDKEGQSDSDTMTVTVTGAEPEPENTPPTAAINAAQVTTAEAGETVELQGVGNDAETAAGSLTFAWNQTGGTPTVSIASATTATASFTAPHVTAQTELTFRLTVTDEGGLSATAETTIAVSPPPEPANTPPTAAINAAQVATAEAGETVRLQGVGNDAETAAGSLTFVWSQVGGTPTVSIANAGAATASFTAPDVTEETDLTFRLTVTDQGGLSTTAETTIAIIPPPEPENTPPTASIDTAQVTTAEAGERVELRGVGNDAETAAGSLTFAWTQVGGTPTVSIAGASTAAATFTAPDVTEETSLTFRLTVTDEGGLSTTAETTIAIIPPPEPENTPPTASIDTAQVTTAEAGERVELRGVGNDAETVAGSLTFAWSQVGGTPTVSIANAAAATASFTAPDVTEETALTFRLTVTDEGGLSADAAITVAISPPPIQPEISIERTGVSLVVREGRAAEFEIVASEATSVDLTLTLEIAVEGDFGVSPGRRTLLLEAGETEIDLAFETDDDDVGEANGLLTVTVVEGAGYTVGPPASAELTVTDNDGGAPLTGISLDGIPLEFAPDRTEYFVRVAHEVAQTAVRTTDGAALQIAANGAPVEVGEVIPLEVGGNVISIARSSAGAVGRWYTVTVTRAAADAEPSSNEWSIHLDPASGVRPADGQTSVDVRVTVECNGSSLLTKANCPFEPGSVTFQVQADGSEPGEATHRTDFGGPRKPFVVERGPQYYVVRLNIRPGSGDAEYVPFVLMENGVQAAEARFQITP